MDVFFHLFTGTMISNKHNRKLCILGSVLPDIPVLLATITMYLFNLESIASSGWDWFRLRSHSFVLILLALPLVRYRYKKYLPVLVGLTLHLIIDVFTHKIAPYPMFLYPLLWDISFLGLFDWSITYKQVPHVNPLTYLVWVITIVVYLYRQRRYFIEVRFPCHYQRR